MTSARVLFQIKGNLKGFDAEKLIAQFNKENEENPYWEGQEAYGKLIKMINNYDKSSKEEIAAIADGSMSLKEQKSFARGRRNGCEPKLIESLMHIIKNSTDKDLRLTAIEALGWYEYSVAKSVILVD
jgi:hypothetical protein